MAHWGHEFVLSEICKGTIKMIDLEVVIFNIRHWRIFGFIWLLVSGHW